MRKFNEARRKIAAYMHVRESNVGVFDVIAFIIGNKFAF